ncbi:DNA-directed RNA polymerase, beta' subunit, predominant form [Halobacteroides halobius DSM 5150]|uniref:DNA-directed RNA polymerase subunit beta' n=1 Tax=Halobacteroides halobius (strain ATCC 35273 / DSM 5150 / MD-1) TaxID=748449 RepID=L0K6N3_HALHC|nr:DNA-directed RNA polymerase subunit beta' [Halobacteroides halobius]AGB40195.1 DNA-directed RNA polymerase, beta' subunit, predominant form [Halobacteroides halobius DSM 5150]
MFNPNNFDFMEIGLASPQKIRSWSSGEVKKPETINYRTLKPEKEGLFCEKIFGPTKDWECHCGKYKRVRYKGVVCDRCGVEVTKSKVRRERMGHIELAAPVSHIWFFKGIPSRLGVVMDMSPRSLEKALYFVSYIVIDPGDTSLSERQLLSESEYREARSKYGDRFKAGMGAEAVKEILANMDLDKEIEELEEEVKSISGQRRKRVVRRLKVLEGLKSSDNKPQWMVLDALPVIPPELRPMVQLDGGRFATSDLNDLYRRVINRNNRLKRLLELGAPEIIIRNEKRMLQESVDALIDNGRRGRPVTGSGNRPLKSLSDMLKGKQGRFRQNLLGKRVDYSGRSVIVVGPDLRLDQCGLPRKMALELFKPFVMKRLVDQDLAHNIKSAKRMVENEAEEVWDVLEEAIKEHPVLLNRAPTLHRLGIQAFEPILVEGKAIRVHPLVCPAYNADFDGDQMAVHVPLSTAAQAECRLLMSSTYNLLGPSNGDAIAVPTQDMILGIYYLTIQKDGAKGEGKFFGSASNVIKAYENDSVTLQTKIKYRSKQEGWIETSVGRVILNDALPNDLPFYNKVFDKKETGALVSECHEELGPNRTADVLDRIKNLTFHYATKSGITIGVTDVDIPEAKRDILLESEEQVDKVEAQYRRGLITENERYQRVVDIWGQAKDYVTEALIDNLGKFNPINMMATSGARGNKSQISQLGGMRGLMADPSGRIIDMPIKSCFREGLSVLEYFISTHGARKGLADTALRTADSGYLTRRLVDVSQDVAITEVDCDTDEGVKIDPIAEDGEIIEPLYQRIAGRLAFKDIVHPETEEIIVAKDEMITEAQAKEIEKLNIEDIEIRSVLTCHSEDGICQKCYGKNLADGKMVKPGEAVGIMGAQSIGEPGTQLTMRTFHTGGVAGDDITQGLPRIEELFEARTPKGQAIVTELEGKVNIVENNQSHKAVIKTEDGRQKTYKLPYGSELKVSDGDHVKPGDRLTKGPLDPEDVLNIDGVQTAQQYILEEVQKVYKSQGVDINDKHVEVIIRQMTNKVKIKESGATDLLPGELIDVFKFEKQNQEAVAEGKEPAIAEPMLLGITKASLNTESFLSAASFQETTRVLTESSLEGKRDDLEGLKENVIVGQLIPAGTGLKKYKDIEAEIIE